MIGKLRFAKMTKGRAYIDLLPIGGPGRQNWREVGYIVGCRYNFGSGKATLVVTLGDLKVTMGRFKSTKEAKSYAKHLFSDAETLALALRTETEAAAANAFGISVSDLGCES
jgi:hypothetical protein